MEKLEPNGQRTKDVITLIWIILVFDIALLILNFYQYKVQVLGIIYLIVFILYMLAFLRWFYTAYSNLHQKVANLSYTKGWAIGSWFVPILNFYRPYKIMKELYCKTETLLIERKILSDKNPSITYLLGWWWFLFIVSNFIVPRLDRPQFRLETETIEQLANIINILLALITIKVIKDYSKMESLLFQTDENYLNEPKLDEPKEKLQENKLQEKSIDMEKECSQTTEEGKYDKFIFLIPIMFFIIGILIVAIINLFRQ
jgi:Ca2+/Na+ antiporter